jgi:hypothetical protein
MINVQTQRAWPHRSDNTFEDGMNVGSYAREKESGQYANGVYGVAMRTT